LIDTLKVPIIAPYTRKNYTSLTLLKEGVVLIVPLRIIELKIPFLTKIPSVALRDV